MLPRRLIVSAIAIAVIVFVGVEAATVIGQRPAPPQHAKSIALPIAVRGAVLERSDHVETLTGYGRARALRRTPVAAEVPGVVAFIDPRLEAGADVTDEIELIRLDDRDLQQARAAAAARKAAVAAEGDRLAAEKETAIARRDKALADWEASKRELTRIRDLMRTGVATESDYDRQSIETSLRETAAIELAGRVTSIAAQVARNTADAEEALAAWTKADNDVARTVIHAPFAGTVVRRHVDRFARVTPGTPLFDLVDPTRVEIAVALPASRHGDVAVGTTVKVRHGGTGLTAKIARVAPEVDAADRTFMAYLEMTGIPPGAFVVADVVGKRHTDVFVLPRTAFVGDRVFVAVDGVACARTPVPLVVLPHVILAREGVQKGERLILTNLEEVADGTKVALQVGPTPDGRPEPEPE